MGRRVCMECRGRGVGVGVGEPLGSCPDRGIRKPTYAVRAWCAVPSQPLVPMQPNVERALHMRATPQGIVPPQKKKEGRERERARERKMTTVSHRAHDAPIAGAGGQDRTQSRNTRRTRRTRYLHKGTGQLKGIWHCRTGSQNSASESESRRPTSLFGRQAPRIVLASAPQVDFHLSFPPRVRFSSVRLTGLDPDLDMLCATSIDLARLA